MEVVREHRPDAAVDADDLALHVEQRAAGVAADELAVGAQQSSSRNSTRPSRTGGARPSTRPPGWPVVTTQSPGSSGGPC